MDFILTREDLDQEIKKLEKTSTDRVDFFSRAITFCSDVLELYRKELRSHRFPNPSAEILFFKEQKQFPLAYLIYYSHRHSLELEFPNSGIGFRKLIKGKIEEINKFFNSNKEFFRYVETKQTFLDEYYFTRNYNDINTTSGKFLYYRDKEFNTSHDVLLGEIKAFQRLLPHLQLQEKKSRSGDMINPASEIQWTSSKIALTELIYALHINGAINNGAVDLITIASAFENLFNIKVDNIYKTYSEIKARKGRRTKYLEELAWKLEEKMKNDDKF